MRRLPGKTSPGHDSRIGMCSFFATPEAEVKLAALRQNVQRGVPTLTLDTILGSMARDELPWGRGWAADFQDFDARFTLHDSRWVGVFLAVGENNGVAGRRRHTGQHPVDDPHPQRGGGRRGDGVKPQGPPAPRRASFASALRRATCPHWGWLAQGEPSVTLILRR